MAKYIDAEKLEKDGWSASRTYQQDEKTIVYETKKMTDFPTADVMEVVRCEKCKRWTENFGGGGYGYCYLYGLRPRTTDASDYCSWWKKKERSGNG